MSLKQIEIDRTETLARHAGTYAAGTHTDAEYALRIGATNQAHDAMRDALLERRSFNRRAKLAKAS